MGYPGKLVILDTVHFTEYKADFTYIFNRYLLLVWVRQVKMVNIHSTFKAGLVLKI